MGSHSLPSQWGRESFHFERATAPNTSDVARTAMPVPPRLYARVRLRRFTGTTTGTSRNAGTATSTTSGVDGTVTRVDQATWPAALASTVCSPGSTGTALPSSAGATTAPSRLTARPATRWAAVTVIASFDSLPSSAAACCSQKRWRLSRSLLARLTAARNAPHALAVLPSSS